MRIAIGADHRGFPYKEPLLRLLEGDGHRVTDLGTWTTEPVDYPDVARVVGLAVRDGAADLGVLICGSGAGVAIAANKIRGVRAALCHDLFTARQAREDDDANVLCLGASVVDRGQAEVLTRTFVSARFSHAERHERRLAKVLALEAAEAAAGVSPTASPPSEAVLALPAVQAALSRLERLEAGRRIWARDAGLWSDEDAVRAAIENRLAWLTAPTAMREHVVELTDFADSVRLEGIADVVLLGMGGSSLAPEVLALTFGAAPGGPALTVLDTTDPGAIREVRARLTLPRTLFVVASKSGTTTEMLALYRYFRAEMERAGVEAPGRHFVAITDASTPLERLAAAGGFRRTFLNDPGIGGRFSALSHFGLVPAALVGIDTRTLVERAASMAAACGASVPVRANPGLRLGAVLGGLARSGRDKVTLMLSEPLRSLGAWLEQLLTESTGKNGKGLIVVHGEPLGPPAAYGSDRVFIALRLGSDAAHEAGLAALEGAGHPVVRLTLSDRFDLGAEFFRWEFATAAAGVVLGLNPFDEPNVAQAKEATQSALATFRDTGQLPEWPVDSADDLGRALETARPGDYVALLAYVTPEPRTTAALQALRALVRDRTRLATTVGYGPRYLHSTGQIHKGGPPTPILVLMATSDREDLPIPGGPYGFGTLKMAQALGDLATLRAAHRRAFWIPLAPPPPEPITRLAAALDKRLGAAVGGH